MLFTTSHRRFLTRALCAFVLAMLALPAVAEAQTAATLFQRAQAREASARKNPTTANLRAAVAAYELVVRRYPRSGYCDDALWNGATVARFAWERHNQTADRATAERLYTWLRKEYPTSSLAKQVPSQLTAMKAAAAPPPARAARPAPARPTPTTPAAPVRTTPPAAVTPTASISPVPSGPVALIRGVSVTALPKGDRITIELDREVHFSSERIADPDRVFFDLRVADFPAAVQTVTERLAGTRLRGVRLGRQADSVTRVVLELAGTPSHSVFQMYHPYRLVIDVESDVVPPPPPPPPVIVAPAPAAAALPTAGPAIVEPPSEASRTAAGDFTLARQLGLGVSRIVIDPGHGGKDPGARANNIEEADLVLDIALRVEALLKKHPGVEVLLTRRTDVYIPLEERTAIANREGADLFLSIHANAAARKTARGVETYFLNFATNPEAEAVAARENASSSTSMGKLPELVQQITLNSKVKESREFAQIVQTSLVRGMRAQNKALLDLGVKQAPFIVLIGAQMPSVLAEISFISNSAEATLLKNDAYKQRIAQSLADAVLKYQASLKKISTVAAR